jgi:hypothetical protein
MLCFYSFSFQIPFPHFPPIIAFFCLPSFAFSSIRSTVLLFFTIFLLFQLFRSSASHPSMKMELKLTIMFFCILNWLNWKIGLLFGSHISFSPSCHAKLRFTHGQTRSCTLSLTHTYTRNCGHIKARTLSLHTNIALMHAHTHTHTLSLTAGRQIDGITRYATRVELSTRDKRSL